MSKEESGPRMEPFRVTVLGPAPLLHIRPLGQGLYVCGTLLGQQSKRMSSGFLGRALYLNIHPAFKTQVIKTTGHHNPPLGLAVSILRWLPEVWLDWAA
ncbi:hypothetical protein H8959_017173 [Pygathrix nigripes]